MIEMIVEQIGMIGMEGMIDNGRYGRDGRISMIGMIQNGIDSDGQVWKTMIENGMYGRDDGNGRQWQGWYRMIEQYRQG